MVQNMTLHNKEDSVLNKKQHEDLDLEIDNIFRDLPPFRAMPTCDAAFYQEVQTKLRDID